tara:strand:- start:35326 stop:35541 length:216 start_codon:yes stop_codon:yes gene_type:complete
MKESLDDANILEWYTKGFNDELVGMSITMPKQELLIRAYTVGAIDAIVGDDIRKVDYQTDEELLKIIKKEY